jgi:hypothetical protein
MCRATRPALIFAAMIAAHAPAQTRADLLAHLYDDATMRDWKARYRVSTAKLNELIVKPASPPRLQSELARVRFEHPLPEEQTGKQFDMRGDPLQYYSDPGTYTVYLPVLSLKFLDDLAIAYTWREAHGGAIDEVFNYVAELKYRAAKDFPGGRYPRPLTELHIPDNALQDPEVNERSLGRFTTARAFIEGHELGHLFGCDRLPNPIEREKCADDMGARIVSDFMKRAQVAPLGVVIYFMAAVHWCENSADFANRQDWEKFLHKADHPLTPDRLTALAAQLEAGSGGDRGMVTVAGQIRKLAAFTADEDVLRGIILVAQAGDRMAGGHPVPAGSRAASAAFDGSYSGTVVFLNDRENGPATLQMALTRRADEVSGRYTFGLGDATLQGKVVSGKLYFQWWWGQAWGNGVMQATENGAGFRGTWGYRDASEGAGTFEGRRH